MATRNDRRPKRPSNRVEYFRLYGRMRRTKMKLARLKAEAEVNKVRRAVADIDAILVKHPDRAVRFGNVLLHVLTELRKGN